MQPNMIMTILGGIAGTIAMTLMMHFLAPLMTGQPMDIAARISGMLGQSYMIGMAIHFMMGIIIFPVIYALVVYQWVPGPGLLRGAIWGAVLWLGAITIVMPMAGAGFLMSEIGGVKAVIAALMGHMVYGILLGSIAGSNRSEQAPA